MCVCASVFKGVRGSEDFPQLYLIPYGGEADPIKLQVGVTVTSPCGSWLLSVCGSSMQSRADLTLTTDSN